MRIASRTDPQVAIRMPQEFVSYIKDTAAKNGRSMNSEVLMLLEQAINAQKEKSHRCSQH